MNLTAACEHCDRSNVSFISAALQHPEFAKQQLTQPSACDYGPWLQ